jgi:conjugative transfer region protein TrbK
MRPQGIGTVARLVAFATIAAAIAVAAANFSGIPKPPEHHAAVAAPARRDPIVRDRARCPGIGMAAGEDSTCEAAWAENRRRFFAGGARVQSCAELSSHPAPTGEGREAP